jgi:hypothetical protein
MAATTKDSKPQTTQGPESILAEVKVISGRRITLPQQVCDEYHLHDGSKLTLVRQDVGWVITNASVASVTMRTPAGVEFEASLPSR